MRAGRCPTPGATTTGANDLNVNVGQNNFDTFKIEYFADYTSAFEAFKGGAYSFREEFLSLLWATGYDFPGHRKGLCQGRDPAGWSPRGHARLVVQPAPPDLCRTTACAQAISAWRSISNGRTKACFTASTPAPIVSGKTRPCRPRACRPRRNWPCWNRCANSIARKRVHRTGLRPRRVQGRQHRRPPRACARQASCWTRRAGPSAPTVSGAMTRASSCASSF